MTIRVGTAPDSWGVWFPDDPRQMPYTRFLDEVAAAGYKWLELGPYGYLPTDPEKLRDELGSRGLGLSAGTVFEGLHRENSWHEVWSQADAVAKLTAALGGTHLVVIPDLWRDPITGAAMESRALTEDQWRAKTGGMDRLGRAIYESHGVRTAYHPHADSHVDTERHVYRFLDNTDGPSSTCAWTPATSVTAAATASMSSTNTRIESDTYTSSRSIRRCGPRSRPRTCRSARPSRWAR